MLYFSARYQGTEKPSLPNPPWHLKQFNGNLLKIGLLDFSQNKGKTLCSTKINKKHKRFAQIQKTFPV